MLFCDLFKACNVCRILENFKKRTVGWKVVTGAYFTGCSYFARVSDFQLHSNFLMAVSSAQKYRPLQSRHNNALFSLPARMGGLGLCNPSANANFEFDSSIKLPHL